LDSVLKSGRARHVGFSFHDSPTIFKEALNYYDWSFCQLQYNYMDINFQAGSEGVEIAAMRDIGVIAMEPLRGGALANNMPSDVLSILKGASKTRTPAEWALRWVWNNSKISMLLSGMNSYSQLEENMKVANSSNIPLLESELKNITAAGELLNNKLNVSCTTCGYCKPCSEGLNIPNLFNAYNIYGLFGNRRSFDMEISSGKSPVACTECGTCESRCPQGIKIALEMKNMRECFGV
jgi:predicted aldo/keto reductase-like oxidoreductase